MEGWSESTQGRKRGNYSKRIEINFEIAKGISVRAFPETPHIR